MFRRLPCKLTALEIKERGSRLAALTLKIEKVESEKSESSKEFGREIKRLSEEATEVSTQIDSGTEFREVKIDVTHDYDNLEVLMTRGDTGEVIERRPMTDTEKNTELFLPVPPAKALVESWRASDQEGKE